MSECLSSRKEGMIFNRGIIVEAVENIYKQLYMPRSVQMTNDGLTNTKRFRNESQFTLWSNFNTELSHFDYWAGPFTFLDTLFWFTSFSVDNGDTCQRIGSVRFLLSTLFWRHRALLCDVYGVC